MDARAQLVSMFDEAMLNIYIRAKDEAGYHANIFLRMLNSDGGLTTAKRLINSPQESDGYTALWLRGRLDLTVEAMVLQNSAWHPLFTLEELSRCKERLIKCQYKF